MAAAAPTPDSGAGSGSDPAQATGAPGAAGAAGHFTAPAPPDTAGPGTRGFWALMATQFQGAFSDNVLKQLVIFLVLGTSLGPAEKQKLISLAGALFAAPFIILSMFGGWMADRFSKRSVMVWVKAAEVGIMGFATWALVTGSFSLQLTAICLMAAQSAFFGPSKYGSMPELLPAHRLSWGNGILEMLTFLAIILGMLLAGWLAEGFQGSQVWSGIILIALALAGLLTSLGITKVPAADPHKPLNFNFAGEFLRQMRWMREDRDLIRAVFGNALFFLIAALVQINIPVYADAVLRLGPQDTSALLAALCLGIGAGSLAAGRLSRGKIEYGLVPVGAALLAVTALAMGWPGISRGGFTVALAFLGIGGGLFIVPIAAVLQHRPPREKKGAVQGAAGLLSWVGILIGASLQGVLGSLFGWTPGQVFWFCAVASAGVGVFVASTRPRAVADMIASWRSPSSRS